MIKHLCVGFFLQEGSTPQENVKELSLTLHALADQDNINNNEEEHEADAVSDESHPSLSPSRKRRRNGVAGDAPDAKKLKTNAEEVVGTPPEGKGGVQEMICHIPGGEKLRSYDFIDLEKFLHPELAPQLGASTGLTLDMSNMNVLNISGMSDSTLDLYVRGSQESLDQVEHIEEKKELSIEDLADCLVDREVVELIRKKVQKKYVEINV